MAMRLSVLVFVCASAEDEACMKHADCSGSEYCSDSDLGEGRTEGFAGYCQSSVEWPCAVKNTIDGICPPNANNKTCASGYTACPNCCDINDDCVCDKHCWHEVEGYVDNLGCSYDYTDGFEPTEGEDRRAIWQSINIFVGILIMPFVFLSVCMRNKRSGWSELQGRYSNVGQLRPATQTLGQPQIFRMGRQSHCSGSIKFAQKFDR